jgi:Protein of unknown function (DUF2490)
MLCKERVLPFRFFNRKQYMMRYIICILLLFSSLYAKTQTTHQSTYWTRVYARIKLNDTYSWQFEADNRRFFNANQQLQFIAHTHLHRKIGKNTEGALGFTFSDTWQGNLPVPELRPFQEFYFFTKLNDKWRFSQRLRMEQRWFHNYAKNAAGSEVLTSGYNFKFRFRYMPRLEYRASEKWVLKLNDEIMYHADDFDQNRLYSGVEYKFSKDLSLELGYLKAYQKRANNKGYYDRDNLRVTMYKDFTIKKEAAKQ